MTDSTRTKTVEKWRRWKKRNRTFPLTPHPNGQWCKRILGKMRFFGVLDDKQAAIDAWNAEKDDLLAGREPASRRSGLTLGELCDKYMDEQNDRIAAGSISRWATKEAIAGRKFIDAIGLDAVLLESLRPADFSRLASEIERSTLGPVSRRKVILAIRTILRWGVDEELCVTPSMGRRFKPPGKLEIEAAREASGVSRFFDRELLLPAIHAADARMLLVILLGLNCAFYAEDTETIDVRHLHLDDDPPWHDFRRGKTNRPRRAVLWPETVEAARQYLAIRNPTNEAEGCLILNRDGQPHAELSRGWTIGDQFNRLISLGGKRPRGAGIGSLRHTAATVMGLSTDQPMIDLVMGHASGSSGGQRERNLHRHIYVQTHLGELERLRKLAEIVRQWLFYGRLGEDSGPKHTKNDENEKKVSSPA